MAGLGLIHLGFLAAAAAVAVPVLIHLLLRPRARRVEIGTLRFLKRVLHDSTRRRKLRRWLLLALRSAAVLLLALLFARPYLRSDATEGREREVVLLIDQSASMSATEDQQTLFARAQEAAGRVLKDLPGQTAVHLAYFDAQGVAPSAEPRIDPARQPGFAGTDYGVALRWARDRMLLSSRNQRKVYLFTDLQRSGLRDTTFDGLPPGVAVEVVEVGKPLLHNLAVEGVEAVQTLVRPREPLVVAASVFNAGPLPVRNATVRLVLEGPAPKVEQTQTVTLPPAARQPVRFNLPITKPGLYQGYVEVAGEDDFPLDDRRWLALDARLPDRLLLVDGQPGVSVFANETYYLEAALRLRLADQGAPLTPYEPERLAWDGAARLPDLAPFRLVALCNVAGLPVEDVTRLGACVAGGGRLLIFTGNQVQADNYEPLRQAGLLPAAVEGTSGPETFRFDTWDKEHPIFRPLSDPQQGDLRRVAFRHITRLRPQPGAKVLAAAQGGKPLLVEGKLGRGAVLLVASAADRDWSDWPQSRLYVPLVHQIVGYLTERLPENQRVRPALAGPGRDRPPGVTREGEAVVVRNLDPRESEIERLTAEEFRQALHLPEPEHTAADSGTAAVPRPAGEQRPDELWVYVVWGLLLVLVVEVFVANRTHA
jgi:hypothetical protein